MFDTTSACAAIHDTVLGVLTRSFALSLAAITLCLCLGMPDSELAANDADAAHAAISFFWSIKRLIATELMLHWMQPR